MKNTTIKNYLSLLFLIPLALFVNAEIKTGILTVTVSEQAKLFLNNTFKSDLIPGKNVIKDIPPGEYKIEVRYADFFEGKIIKIVPDENIFVQFDYTSVKSETNADEEEMSKRLRIILDQAYDLLGKAPDSTVIINGRKFLLDCSGTVMAIFFAAGIDLQKMYMNYSGGGVTRIFKLIEANKSLNEKKYPEVADVIFWDNTWDRNNDGKFGNDPLTHVGIVTKVDDDGTIHFIHAHRIKGVVVEKMNLFTPGVQFDITGKEINSPLHMNSGANKKNNLPYLAGELWRSNGGVLKFVRNGLPTVP